MAPHSRPSPDAPRARRLTLIATIIGLVVSVLLNGIAPATASTPRDADVAPAAVADSIPLNRGMAPVVGFQAGNIISDAVFFDSSTMTAAQIDSFLRGKVTTCRAGYTCLKDFTQSTPNRPADAYCNGYAGAQNESAATILYKAAKSCGINPQVLIVMLEKEQGLVTHTWPSQWRYDMALGQGCPDTAPCDPAFAGFFYQIFGAARQMKIYTEGKYFTWYAPGKTWNVQYHPNLSCGTSPVYIANKATAALYYYTPYQPNAAALAAGFGTGDACSAYGNRNFHNFFTSWFGDLHTPTRETPFLAKSATAPEIYLVVDNIKMHVQSRTDLLSFSSRLGDPKIVSTAALAAHPVGDPATRLIRDGRDGAMYVIEPDGTRHWFSSAEQVTRYGFAMQKFVTLPPKFVDSYTKGEDVGNYFRGDTSPAYYKWEAATKRHIVNGMAWNYASKEAKGYVMLVDQGIVDKMAPGGALLGPRSLVKEANASEVFIAGFGPELLHISSWTSAYELGVTDLSIVPDGTLARNPRVSGSLLPFIACADTRYVIGGGGMTPISGSIGNTPSVSLPASVCDALPQTGVTLTAPFLIKNPAAPEIFQVSAQGFKHIKSESDLKAWLGTRTPGFYSSLSTSTISMMGTAPWLREKALVSFGSDEIYVMQDGLLRHVLSRDTLLQISAPNWPSVAQIASKYRSSYPVGADLP